MKIITKDDYTRRKLLLSLLVFCIPQQALAKKTCKKTPSQPKGPFYKNNISASSRDMTKSGKAKGEKIELKGKVLDKFCNPIPNVIIKIWQANSFGKYLHNSDDSKSKVDENFSGFSQINTDNKGFYKFITIKPGSYKVSDRLIRTPHIHLSIITSNNKEFATQIYFKDHPLNKNDFLLNSLKNKDLLQIKFKKNETGLLSGNFNIVL